MASTTSKTSPPQSVRLRKKPAVDSGVLNDAQHYPDIDLSKAVTCAEFSRLCYRRRYYGNATAQTVAFQQKEKSILAGQFLYKAKVFSSADQQCVIFHHGNDVIVAFEGSRALKMDHYWRNLASYFFAWFTPAPDAITRAAREVTGDKEAIAKVHYGFDNALNAPIITADSHENGHAMWNEIKKYCKELHTQNPKTKLYFTGHSAGGALATIAAARTLNDMPEIEIGGLYTFGQPRVGGKYFKAGFEKLLGRDKYYRFEQYGDPMPALPPFDPEQYVPVGRWIPMDLDGHLLAREQFKEDQPTLSEANPALYDKIEQGFAEAQPLLKRFGATLTSAANESAALGANFLKRYVLPADLIDVIPYDLKRSYSSLQDLFSSKNFTIAHKIRNYSAAIQKHIDQHHLLGDERNVQFLHGQLISCINEAADLMQHVAPFENELSPALKSQLQTALPKINHLMQECEILMRIRLPEDITAPVPEKRRAWNPISHPADWFAPYWSSPLTDETLESQAIQKTLVKALLDPNGTLNRSGLMVKQDAAISRLKTVNDLFTDIQKTMAENNDREVIASGREDLRSLPFLIDSVAELCEQMKSAMKRPEKSAAIAR